MSAVLLVEDVEILRMVLGRFLSSAGHSVTECAGGDEARRLAAAQPFDVIVTDLWMKNGDGLDFIRSQSALAQSRPVIAMTGGDPSASRSRSLELAREAGAVSVLSKPVTKTEILKAIDAALAVKA